MCGKNPCGDGYKYPGSKIKFFFITVYKNLRRIFYITFRKKYIAESIAKRKGECQHQGCCAAMIVRCPHLKNCKDCDLYPNFPYICGIYPFDEKDKHWWSKEHCAFYWEKEK
jgi:Fe-S-cluster containining protein